jgi:hypothetical protein
MAAKGRKARDSATFAAVREANSYAHATRGHKSDASRTGESRLCRRVLFRCTVRDVLRDLAGDLY